VLEAVSQITHSSAETPREQAFQKDYSKQIDAAIEQLKEPINLANPHSCWLQLRQVNQLDESSLSDRLLSLAVFDVASNGQTIRNNPCHESDQS
jgi:hypothetical protein